MSNSIFTIILLALLGFFVGRLLAGAAKWQNKKSRAVVPHEQNKQEPEEMTRRQLVQLKQQLRSGLITKEEYQEKERILLQE